jgi:hypothetical protein
MKKLLELRDIRHDDKQSHKEYMREKSQWMHTYGWYLLGARTPAGATKGKQQQLPKELRNTKRAWSGWNEQRKRVII